MSEKFRTDSDKMGLIDGTDEDREYFVTNEGQKVDLYNMYKGNN